MSRETSPDAGKPYGLERVCRVLEFPRSTIPAQPAREIAKAVPLPPVRRGPKPKIPDLGLLAVIRADLETSPFVGEGHRKAGARLRILSGIRVQRSRLPPDARERLAVAASGAAGRTHPVRWFAPGRGAKPDGGPTASASRLLQFRNHVESLPRGPTPSECAFVGRTKKSHGIAVA